MCVQIPFQIVFKPLLSFLNLTFLNNFSSQLIFEIQVGLPHPDPVVETASLASVESADVWKESDFEVFPHLLSRGVFVRPILSVHS